MAVKKKSYKRQSSKRKPFWEGVVEWSLGLGKKLVIPALVIWLIGWLWLGGIFHQGRAWVWNEFVGWTASQGLQVQDVVIEGRNRTNLAALKSAIQVEINDPVLSVDVDVIQRRIKDLPWIKDVIIRRNYNGLVLVRLTERIPFVLWNRPGRPLAVVDTDGQVIDGAHPRDFGTFLVVSGVDAPKHVVPLMQTLMAEPEMVKFIKGAEWIGDRRWDLISIHGTRILLPEDDMGFALSRLVKVQQDKNILDQRLLSIDLRGDDRIIIETERGEARDVMSLSSLLPRQQI